jgi:hypothetical protein
MEIQPQVNPMQSSRYCGVSLGYAGDINKDSYNDMIVSCYNDYRGGVQNGSAMIFYGCKSNRHTAAAPEPGCSLRGFYGVADPLDAVPANRITAMPLLNSSTSCVQGGACQPMVIYPKAVSTITGGTNMYWGRNVGSPGDINGDGYSDIFIGAYEFQLPCTTAACPATPLTIAGAAVLYTGSPTGLNAAPNVTYYPLCENGVCTPYYIRPSMSGWGTTSTAACYFSYNTVFNQPRSYDYNNDGLADFLIYSAFYANPSSDPRQSTVVSGGFFTFQ